MNSKRFLEFLGMTSGKFYTIPRKKNFPFRYFFWSFPLICIFGKMFVINERKKFKLKLKERDNKLMIRFEDFSSNFDIDQTTIRNAKNDRYINFKEFDNKYLLFYLGDAEYFLNLYNEFLELLKKREEIHFFFIFEDKSIANTFLKLSKGDFEKTILTYCDEGDLGLVKDNLYCVSPEKNLIFLKKADISLKNKKVMSINLFKNVIFQINRDIDKKLINRFDFTQN